MKHDDREKRFRKQRSAESGSPIVKAGPSLREFWAELQRAKAAGEPLPAMPSASPASRAANGSATPNLPSAWSSGSFRSSGSGSGSGSGGAGYGLALISSDPESQARIRRIMQSLCEQDAKRGR